MDKQNRATAVTVVESEEDMIKLAKIFNLLENDIFVSIKEGEKEIYSGECGKCTRDILRYAYVKDIRYDIHLERYVIRVIYV